MSKGTIKSLKKETSELKAEIESMKKDFPKFEQDTKSTEARSATNVGTVSTTLQKETVRSLEYLSNEYDDSHI